MDFFHNEDVNLQPFSIEKCNFFLWTGPTGIAFTASSLKTSTESSLEI